SALGAKRRAGEAKARAARLLDVDEEAARAEVLVRGERARVAHRSDREVPTLAFAGHLLDGVARAELGDRRVEHLAELVARGRGSLEERAQDGFVARLLVDP